MIIYVNPCIYLITDCTLSIHSSHTKLSRAILHVWRLTRFSIIYNDHICKISEFLSERAYLTLA